MNIFDFVDYLESTGYESGTANENRYFLFTTLEKALEATDDYNTVKNAYESIGVTFPESAFSRIFDAYLNSTGPAYFINYLAPTSLIPEESIPLSDYPGESQYVVYSEVTVYDRLTDLTTVQHWTHYTDELTTPAQLKDDIEDSVSTFYNWQSRNVKINRIYKSS